MSPAVVTGLLVALAVVVAPRTAGLGSPAPGEVHPAVRRQDLHLSGVGAGSGADAGAAIGTGDEMRTVGSGPPTSPTSEEVTSALVLLALGYRSGLPTWNVLTAVGEVLAHPEAPDGSAVTRDLRQVAAALRWGASDDEAWASVGEVWSGAGRAVAIAHRAGIPPGPLLLSAADELRKASLERVELAAARVGVQLVAPLGLVLLPAFCLTTVVPLVMALGRQLLSG